MGFLGTGLRSSLSTFPPESMMSIISSRSQEKERKKNSYFIKLLYDSKWTFLHLMLYGDMSKLCETVGSINTYQKRKRKNATGSLPCRPIFSPGPNNNMWPTRCTTDAKKGKKLAHTGLGVGHPPTFFLLTSVDGSNVDVPSFLHCTM